MRQSGEAKLEVKNCWFQYVWNDIVVKLKGNPQSLRLKNITMI
jgi:hypothetical protein